MAPPRPLNLFPARRQPDDDDIRGRLAALEQRAREAELEATKLALWLFCLQYAQITHAKETGAAMPHLFPSAWRDQ